MLIQNSRYPALPATTKTSQPVAATPKEEKRSSFEEFSDCLVASNHEVLPTLSSFGLGYMWGNLGVELGSQFGVGAAAIGGVGLALAGSVVGYELGTMLNEDSDAGVNILFNSPSSTTKAIVKTAIGVAAFGLVGGPTGAAIYGASVLGTAAGLMSKKPG